MNKVKAWCMKDEDGKLYPNSISNKKLWVEQSAKDCIKVSGRKAEVVPVEITEVENDT